MEMTIQERDKIQFKIAEAAGEGVTIVGDWRKDGVKFTLMQPKQDKKSEDNHVAFAYTDDGDLIPDKPTFDQKAVNKAADEASTDNFKVEVEVVTP